MRTGYGPEGAVSRSGSRQEDVRTGEEDPTDDSSRSETKQATETEERQADSREEHGPGRRIGKDVVMHTGRTKRGRYTPQATAGRVRAQETTESRRYPRRAWNPQPEDEDEGSDDTSSQEEHQGEQPDRLITDRDEYWHGMTVEEMAQYDTDQVQQAHYFKTVTGEYRVQ